MTHHPELVIDAQALLGEGPLWHRRRQRLIWVDIEDNSYIKFQSDGATIAIDPTYGLNEGSSTSSGSCSAACTKVSATDISGQCCTCSGTKRYKRSTWNASTYLCQ